MHAVESEERPLGAVESEERPLGAIELATATAACMTPLFEPVVHGSPTLGSGWRAADVGRHRRATLRDGLTHGLIPRAVVVATGYSVTIGSGSPDQLRCELDESTNRHCHLVLPRQF